MQCIRIQQWKKAQLCTLFGCQENWAKYNKQNPNHKLIFSGYYLNRSYKSKLIPYHSLIDCRGKKNKPGWGGRKGELRKGRRRGYQEGGNDEGESEDHNAEKRFHCEGNHLITGKGKDWSIDLILGKWIYVIKVRSVRGRR